MSGQSESGISDSKPGLFLGSTFFTHTKDEGSGRRTVDVQRGFLPISLFAKGISKNPKLLLRQASDRFLTLRSYSHVVDLSNTYGFLRAKYIVCIHPY